MFGRAGTETRSGPNLESAPWGVFENTGAHWADSDGRTRKSGGGCNGSGGGAAKNVWETGGARMRGGWKRGRASGSTDAAPAGAVWVGGREREGDVSEARLIAKII